MTAPELNIFQKKMKNSWTTKISQQTFIEYKQMISIVVCGYFYIVFVDFRLKGKSLLDYCNLFSPNEYKKNDKIILKYFQ